MTGPQTLAVNDANARMATYFTCPNESMQRVFCLGYGHPVQVDLVLHAEISAGQFAHRAPADTWAMKTQAFAGASFRLIDVSLQAFLQRLTFILACKACPCTDLAPMLRRGPRLAQRFRVAHQAAEQTDVISSRRFVVFLSSHRDYPD